MGQLLVLAGGKMLAALLQKSLHALQPLRGLNLQPLVHKNHQPLPQKISRYATGRIINTDSMSPVDLHSAISRSISILLSTSRKKTGLSF